MAGLTKAQRTLADGACARARTLVLRIRALAQAVWSGKATQADGAAVYSWFVELDLSDQLAGVAGLGGVA
jgi:hypothetical protein